jgi:hypothetical protein
MALVRVISNLAAYKKEPDSLSPIHMEERKAFGGVPTHPRVFLDAR